MTLILTCLKSVKSLIILTCRKSAKMTYNLDLPKVSKMTHNRDYKSMSKDRLLSALKASESLTESEKNFDDTKPKIKFSKPRIEKTRKEFNESRYKFSKSKTKEIRKNLYETENENNLFAPKIKEIERYLLALEENYFKPKKYYDYDNTEYKGIRNVQDLFDLSIDKDYYKPVILHDAFNNTIFNMKIKEMKTKY